MNQSPSSVPAHDYKEWDLPLVKLALWVVGLFAMLGGVIVFVYLVYGTPTSKPVPEVVLKRPMNQPVLQSNGASDMRAFRKEQEEALKTYGWVNRAQGVVRVPIARAMEMVLQKGLPARGSSK
jgi:hypothetical protein